MTQYKNGDKVLVEFEIIRMSDCGASVQLEWPNKHNITVLNTDDIHSLAPEFKVGERIGCRDEGMLWDDNCFYICHSEYGIGVLGSSGKFNFFWHFYIFRIA